MSEKLYIISVLFILASTVTSQWTCSSNADCSELEGSICLNAACLCPGGTQPALGGIRCVDIAPYHTSTCYEDSQCSRLFTGFECRRTNETNLEGGCHCQTGYHYFLGRCWQTVDFGQACTRDEECLTVPTDPYSLTCSGTCICAEGYYQRQRGECRKIAYGVGERCVVNEDCQFANGVCDLGSLSCVVGATVANNNVIATKTNSNNSTLSTAKATLSSVASVVRQYGQACESACPDPFVCLQSACVCPVGYYSTGTGTVCYAELGSPSTAEQCIGLLAEVIDGVCKCPNNFLYEENMRDCVRMTRVLSESCVNDNNCHTFGAMARCGEPDADNFGLRSCECDADESVWDASRNMCRLFAGIGEQCEEDSDCLAGELEVQCVANDQGQGYCACPEGLVELDGLCLTLGLGLNDTCQSSVECTGVDNTACLQGVCDCVSGYIQENGTCAPTIGGGCVLDNDCVIENTVCSNATENAFTCQCNSSYVAYDDICWPTSPSYGSSCNVTAQCIDTLGENSVCLNEECLCEAAHHYRDGRCWPIVGLFQSCSRISECYLSERSEVVECRNGLCQCHFDYPYVEELGTCLSAASNVYISLTLLLTSLLYSVVFSRV